MGLSLMRKLRLPPFAPRKDSDLISDLCTVSPRRSDDAGSFRRNAKRAEASSTALATVLSFGFLAAVAERFFRQRYASRPALRPAHKGTIGYQLRR
jgi:hypothetical protein